MSKLNQRQNAVTHWVDHFKDRDKSLFELAPVALVEGIWGKSFQVLAVNKSAVEFFGAKDAQYFQDAFDKILRKMPHRVLLEVLSARLKGDVFEAEFRLPMFHRKTKYVCMRLAFLPFLKEHPQHVLLCFQDISYHHRRVNFLKKLSQIDGLTKVLNQRTIIQRLDEELSRARRYQEELCCVIIDIDNFKDVNDAFGHLWGDKCLVNVVRVLKSSLRRTDIVGRYGGDEFLAIFPGTNPEKAVVPVERFLKAYTKMSEIKRYQKSVKTTLSVGISGFPQEGVATWQDLLKAADQALYLSKKAGGECYHLSAEVKPHEDSAKKTSSQII